MELELWVHLTKSLARSSVLTVSQNANSILFIAAYLAAIRISTTRQLILSFLCLIGCLIASRSLIYELVNGWQLHVVYLIIYLIAVPYIKQLRVMLALFAMASFNAVMAWDAFNYAHTETWLYVNYESITTLMHVLVISSGIDRGRLIKFINDSIDSLRIIISNSCAILHI